jgi:hypothetical protein
MSPILEYRHYPSFHMKGVRKKNPKILRPDLRKSVRCRARDIWRMRQGVPPQSSVTYVSRCSKMLKYKNIYTQGVPGGMCQTSEGCSLC